MIFTKDTAPQGTVRDWLDHLAKTDDIAFTFPDEDQNISWRELQSAAISIASHLTSLGVEKGESIAIIYPNSLKALQAIFGVFYGGYRATMINLVAGQDAISYVLDHSEARFAFVDDSVLDIFNNCKSENLNRLEIDLNFKPTELPTVSPNDHALLMYTSGTTGRPKGVLHSHASLLAGGWTTAVAHQLESNDRGLCVLPIYHINGLCVTIMGSLISGGSLVMCAKFSASKFWQTAKENKITWFSIVPTIVSHLLHGEAEPDQETKSRIRFGRSASSPLSPDVQAAFENRFEIAIIETMGLTETAAQILSNPLPPATRKISSPGIAFGNEVAIFDHTGKPCPMNTEGEIVVRGPNVMLSYLKNPEATQSTFTQDWLRTGDLGRMDDDGYIFVTGRLKELIIKGGENIAPREIDEALYSHPDVVEAAAFSVKCNIYGETVEAAVKLADGSNIVENVLQNICQQKLGSFKRPNKIHILEDLPKGPSGKIQRSKIQSLVY